MPTATSPGSHDDFLYILLTLLVVPIRWARTHAWRAPTLAWETAATRFYRELGARMNISDIPATFTRAERFFDSFEHKSIAYSPAGAVLMASTVQVHKSRLPVPISPLAWPMLSAMFDDDRLTNALGLPGPTGLATKVLATVFESRNAVHRHSPMSIKPHFVPGEEGSSLYPNG